MLHIRLFRRRNDFHPTSRRQQPLAGGWLLRRALPMPLSECAAHPDGVRITMETCPAPTLLPWESTGAPQMFIFHLDAAEPGSL